MPLKLKCPCGEKLTAPDSAVGKKGKCPKCGVSFIIPAQQAVATAASKPSTHARPAAAQPANGASAVVASRPPGPAAFPEESTGFDDLAGLDLPAVGSMDDLFDESFVPAPAPEPQESLPQINPYASPQTESKAKPGLAKHQRGLRRVATGSLLVMWGAVFLLGALFFNLSTGVVVYWIDRAYLPLVLLLAGGANVIGALLTVYGKILCLSVPGGVRGKRYVVGSLCFDLLAFIAGVFIGLQTPYLLAASIVGLVCSFATIMLFVWFMRRVAVFLGEKEIAREDTTLVLILMATFYGFLFPASLIPCLGHLLLLGILLYATYKFIELLQSIATAIHSYELEM